MRSEGCGIMTQRDPALKKDLITRLNRIGGQVEGVKKMVEDDRYCDDILIQLIALDKSIKSLANKVLENHMHTCVVHNIKEGNEAILDDVFTLIRRLQ